MIDKDATDKCLKAFTPFSFGIVTDEPAKCRISNNRDDEFEAMYPLNGKNILKYNHSQTFSIPNPDSVTDELGDDLGEYIY